MVELQHFDGLVDADSDEEYGTGLQSLYQMWEGEAKGLLQSFIGGSSATRVTLLSRPCYVQKEDWLGLVILLWHLRQTLGKTSTLY